MISQIQRNILDTLLNKFEARKDYGKSEKSRRRTILHVNKKTYPDYFHVSDSRFRRNFNADVEELERDRFIQIEWERFSEKEKIDKLILLEGSLKRVYEQLGRISKREKYERIGKVLSEFQAVAPDCLLSFYLDVIRCTTNFLPLPSIINLDSEKETKDAIYGLHELLKNEEEIPKRNWSIKLYGDSKKWEKIQGKILNVIRTYGLSEEDSNLIEDNQLIGEYGVLNNPHLIRMSGNIIINKNGKTIDLSLFTPDIGVNPRFFNNCAIESVKADAIITIENLTSYHDYLFYKSKHELDEIVLYLGGYHNYGRRLILNKLKKYMEDSSLSFPFYHWGDIDLYGFHIWKHLRNKTKIDFKPLYMDASTYLKYIRNGKPIKVTDLKQMENLLERDEYSVFHHLISHILEHKKIIEQEAVVL